MRRFAAVLFKGLLPFAVGFATDAAASWSNPASISLGSGRGASWGDFDGDRDPDLFVAVGFGGGGRLLRNDGGAAFADIVPPGFAAGNCFAGIWGDADEDRDLDLYITKTSGTNQLLRNDGAAGFSDATGGLPLGMAGTSLSPSWCDVDRDGDLDLFVARGGADRLLRNDGTAGGPFAFVDATPIALADAANTRTAVWGDADDDGDDDLYVVNSGSPNRLLRNDGAPGEAFTFVDATASPLDAEADGRGAVWADLDGDLDLDLVVTNFLGPDALLRNDGTPGGPFAFADATPAALADSSNGQSVVAEDFDLDGDLDLYIVNDGTPNALCRNEGGLVFVNVASGPEADPSPGVGGAAADFDGDGDCDLFVANSGAPSRFLRNDEDSGRGFLQVDLAGDASNQNGVGARVRVAVAGVWQSREVVAGSGTLSQSAATLGFGLADAAEVDSVVVRWPSGLVRTDGPIAANVRVTLVESPPSTAVALASDHAAPLVVRPLPARGAVRILYGGDGALSAARLSITDVLGRVVRVIASGASIESGREFIWNGRRDDGRRAVTGIYFARLESREGLFSARISLLN